MRDSQLGEKSRGANEETCKTKTRARENKTKPLRKDLLNKKGDPAFSSFYATAQAAVACQTGGGVGGAREGIAREEKTVVVKKSRKGIP